MATPPTESDAMTSSFRNPLFDPSNAEVDIVFVHGIGGDSVSTWRSQKGVYWPEELLPSKIRNARILSWPHAAKIGQFFSRRGADYTIDDISKNLLRDVFAYRRDTKTSERPIIFAAHSLGGIIVLNALVLAQTQEDVRSVGDRVHALALLGTPLRGSKWPDRVKIYGQLLGFKHSIASDDLVKGSRKLDSILEESFSLLRQWGREREGGFLGACFFEQEGVLLGLRSTKIVEKEDAVTDLFESIGLPGDHQSMCRFDAITDKGYERISDKLKTWVEQIGVGKHDRREYLIGGSTFGPNNGGLIMASFVHRGSTPVISEPQFTYNGYKQGL